jgi:hypothetical protein
MLTLHVFVTLGLMRSVTNATCGAVQQTTCVYVRMSLVKQEHCSSKLIPGATSCNEQDLIVLAKLQHCILIKAINPLKRKETYVT